MLSRVHRPVLTGDRFRRDFHALRDPPGLADVDPLARAEVLLCAWLSPDQRACYERFGYFDVVGSASGKKFRIGRGTISNIHELDEHGDTAYAWCFVPRVRLVSADEMLAQKIALETSEREVLRIANREPPRLWDVARTLSQIPASAILRSFANRACWWILDAVRRPRPPI
jgi:hypothetical protein